MSIALFGKSKREKDGLHYTCKDCVHHQRKRRYAQHAAELIAQSNATREAKRIKLLGHYSKGTMACACCGERHLEFLTLDHIAGDGAAHRRIAGSGNQFYLWLIRNGMPEGLRVLCMNCNFSLGKRGYCPHQAAKDVIVVPYDMAGAVGPD